MNPLPHLATRLFNTPLLIQGAKLDVILQVLGPRFGWPKAEETLPKLAPQTTPLTPQREGIAVIPIHGTLVRRALAVEAASGLISYPWIEQQLQQALADPNTAGIVLDIDSPGGESGGVFELAEFIRQASQQKPIWAVTNDQAFSAAYALAAACDQIVITRTGGVGSIGVIALHTDQSKKDEQDGYRFSAVYAGGHKNDLSPHAPLSAEAHSALQAEVDRLYGLFTASVATHRNLSIESIRGTEARLYFAENALIAGLADRIGTLSEAIDALQSQLISTEETTLMAHPDPQLDTPPVTTEAAATQTPATSKSKMTTDAPAIETDLNAMLQNARTEERAEIQVIVELCALAGQPQLAGGFIANKVSQADVRHALLERLAAEPEITSQLTPQAQRIGINADDQDHNPLLRLVRKQFGG